MIDAAEKSGAPPTRRWSLSLRALLGVTVLGSALFGWTFSMYSGGYTPSKGWILDRWNLPTGTQGEFGGDGNWFGLPACNWEIFESVEFGANDEAWEECCRRSYQRRIDYHYGGIAFNLVFWQIFAAGLWWSGGRIARRVKRFHAEARVDSSSNQ